MPDLTKFYLFKLKKMCRMLKKLGWKKEFGHPFTDLQTETLIPGRIISRHKNHYRVAGAFGEAMAVIRGKIHYSASSNRDYPVVGDWVVLSTDAMHQPRSIQAIFPRHNALMRKMPGSRKRTGEGRTEEQVIGANIDYIFIVMGLDRDYNLNRLERYLTLVLSCNIKPVIVLNKTDLCLDVSTCLEEVRAVSGKFPVHAICAKRDSEVNLFHHYITEGITGSLIGSSGVGKSTIINALLGQERQRITEINTAIAKGRHTTTQRELILLPRGGLLMDNPGMREIQLWADAPFSLDAFEDIEELATQCKFNDCRHETEPGCAVKHALETGALSEKRLANYLKQKRELDYLEKRQSMSPRMAEREKWREIYRKADIKNASNRK
jgi:ribosome biogenesis GTPase